MGIVRPAQREKAQENAANITYGLDGVVKSYTETWLVETSDFRDDASIVITATNLPAPFQPYLTPFGGDLSAILTGYSPRRRGKSLWWEVDCHFTTLRPQQPLGSDVVPPDPNAPGRTTASLTFEDVLVPIDGEPESLAEGANLRPFVNSAGEPFNPPPLMEESRPVLIVSEYLGVLSFDLARKFHGAVNKDNFLGAPERTVRCKIQVSYQDGWLWTYRFAYKKSTWDITALNQGTYYLAGGTTKTAFVTEDGHPRMGNLDANGDALADGAPPTFRKARKYPEVEFAPLNIPAALQRLP